MFTQLNYMQNVCENVSNNRIEDDADRHNVKINLITYEN